MNASADPPSRAEPSASWRRRLGDMGVGVVLALGFAGIAVFLLPTREEAVSTGGEGRLGLYVKRGERVHPGAAGEVLLPRDAVQFTYSGTKAGHLAVLGIDAEGEVAVLYPEGARAAPWSPTEPNLGQSTVLDDSLGPAMFVGIFCPEPIDLASARQALAKAASTPERFALLTCKIDLLPVEKRAP